MPVSSPLCQLDQIQSVVSATVNAQQAAMLTTLTQHLTKLIELINFSNSPTLTQPSVSGQNPQVLTLPSIANLRTVVIFTNK